MDWYQDFIDECQGIVTEYGFTSRWSKVEGYHLLGTKIVEIESKYESTYGKGLIEKIAKTIKVSPRTVNYAVQFSKKFPDIDLLPEGKDLSWSKIIKKYLTKNESEPVFEICPTCGHKKRV